MDNIEISIANVKHRDGLIDLFNKSIFKAMEDEGFEGHELLKCTKEEVDYKMEIMKEAFDIDVPKRIYLVAIENGKIIGTICYGPCSDIILNHGKKDRALNEIGSAYVLPEYQGKGIITILINHLVMILRSRGIKEVCVDSGYDKAKKIWVNKFGEPNMVLKDYWDDGVDHFIWYLNPEDIKITYKRM